jgi:hypothetical protein
MEIHLLLSMPVLVRTRRACIRRIVPKSHDSSEESEVEEDNEIEEEEAGSGYPTKSQSVERTYKGIWP